MVLRMSLRVSAIGLEDYLTTIFRLLEVYGYAKTTLISKELGVKPATVSKVLKYLEVKGFVKRVKYRGVTLTNKGLELVKPVIRKHRIAEFFLSEFLGFDLYYTHLYAHEFEHLPDDVLEKIYLKLGSPTTCPHGNLIDVSSTSLAGVKLSTVNEGSKVEVIRVAGELTYVLKELQRLGIKLGTVVSVVKQKPLHTVIEVVEGGVYELPKEYAEAVICRVI